jgi:hypothetical protein
MDGADVEAADSTALETEAATLEAADEREATVDDAGAAEEDARTAAQAAWAAVKTERAWSPQAVRTQDVAAAVIADWLDSSHWHARSVAPQLVAEATASEIQDVAHAGI